LITAKPRLGRSLLKHQDPPDPHLSASPQLNLQDERAGAGGAWSYLTWIVLYAAFIAAYVGLRFSWDWLPGDAVWLTTLSQNVYAEGTLTPRTGAYPYGFAYPSLNTFLSYTTGLPIADLQKYVQPFLIALLAPLAFVAFRSLTGSAAVGALASFLLFFQTEFVFEAVRGSHAKLTWGLALIMLFLLSRSFHTRRSTTTLARWVILFYLATFGLITSSSFFASNYVAGIAFAFLGGLLLARWVGRGWHAETQLRRLLYTVLACAILFYLFYFYIYPPALRQFQTLETIFDRVATFLLDAESGANPYAYVQRAWVHPLVYPLLTSLSWLILILSFAYWLRKTRSLFRDQAGQNRADILLWLFYTAFAGMLAISVLLDLAGVLSANLQLRIFPNFMIFAIPMAGQLLAGILARARRWAHPRRWMAGFAFAALALFFSVASLFKATNEPLVNNIWLFQTTQERSTLAWVGDELHAVNIWTGFDSRLNVLYPLYPSWKSNHLGAEFGVVPRGSRYFILSNPMEILAARLEFPLPDLQGELRIYDNGGAALYHTRPKTPFQP
jgi:hypothetical protein